MVWWMRCRPVENESTAPQTAAALDERESLYRRVLEDLALQAASGGIADDAYEPIHAFYSDQLARMELQQQQLADAQANCQLLEDARNAAIIGQYSEAISQFAKLQDGERYGSVAAELMVEVQQKQAKEEEIALARQIERRAMKVASLHNDAKRLIELGNDAEALKKLQDAIGISPDDALTLQVIDDVKRRMEEAKHEQQLARDAEAAKQEPERIAPLTSANAGDGTVESSAFAESGAPMAAAGIADAPDKDRRPQPARFADATEEEPSQTHRLIDAASKWSSLIKPFLLDNVGWFVGVFLVITGFVILILTFWSRIEQNQLLMHSLVYASLASATAMFFMAAYFMRRKYPQLESSSNVLLVIVALLIPLVFAAATLTSLVPVTPPSQALINNLR